jgi:hypothetical protein
MVLQALLTVLAESTRPARADRDACANRHIGDGRTRAGYDARHLVAEHHRLLDAHGPEAAVIEVMQIGTADAASSNAYEQLVSVGFGSRNVLDA